MKSKTNKAKVSGSLAQAVALLGLAVGAAVPMAGCSSEQSSTNAASSQPSVDEAAPEEGSKAVNPCAVKKKKGPCAVGG